MTRKSLTMRQYLIAVYMYEFNAVIKLSQIGYPVKVIKRKAEKARRKRYVVSLPESFHVVRITRQGQQYAQGVNWAYQPKTNLQELI